MDDYAGRVLADRYRLPLPPGGADAPADAYELAETRAFDTYSGQEVLVRQVPLPEFVDAEVLDGEGGPAGARGGAGRATRRPAEPVVRRAIEAAQAAAQIPDHPLLDQVFDVFAEAGSLWIVSERVAARPLAALLAEQPLNPYRAAEIGADVLTALRALHAHGWVHRNITARTVLVCDDGRVVLSGLAVGAAEEALCGYAPVPETEPEPSAPGWHTPEIDPGDRRPTAHDPEGYDPEDSEGHDDSRDFQGSEDFPDPGHFQGSGTYPDSGDLRDSGGLGGFEGAGRFGKSGGFELPGSFEGPGEYDSGSHGRGAGASGVHDAGSHGSDGHPSGEYDSGPYGSEPYEAEVYEEGGGPVPYGADETGGLVPVPAPVVPGTHAPVPYGTPDHGTSDHGASGYGTPDPGRDPSDTYDGSYDSYDSYDDPYTDADTRVGTAAGSGVQVHADAYTEADAHGDADEAPHGADTLHDPDDGDGSASPYGTAPGSYGSDPYGRSAGAPAEQGSPPVPPTADVRASRAGAIAAYRAGARAAAAIGESGALPVQRPAPQDPPAPPPPPTAQAVGSPEPQWWARVADEAEEDEGDDGDDPYDDGARPAGPPAGPRTGPPPRVMLAGNWSDGPHTSRDGSAPISAGGSGPVLPGSGRPALPAGYTAATPDPDRLPDPDRFPVPVGARQSAPAGTPAEAYRGPGTRLAAERARQTRIAVVGAVTERWAPEQAGPVHENWRLAPPIGPATDLWALGALLYRAVQGHAPYPEDNAAELVQLVCAEPPAFAEECGPLRPVVESLLRQDPTERPDFEELRGWLRSLVRSAPEPEAGAGTVPPPPFDEARLPIVRRRGELVRRRRGSAGAGRHRHKRGKEPRPPAPHGSGQPPEYGTDRVPTGYEQPGPGYEQPGPGYEQPESGYEQRESGYAGRGPGGGREESGLGAGDTRQDFHEVPRQDPHDGFDDGPRHAPARQEFHDDFDEEPRQGGRGRFGGFGGFGGDRHPQDFHEEIPQRAPRAPRTARSSGARRPGSGTPKSLGRTLVVLVFLLLGGAVAYAVLVMPGDGETPNDPTATGPAPSGTAQKPGTNPPTGGPSATTARPTAPRTTTPPPADPSAPALAAGYTLRKDPEGFRIGVPNGWRRSPINDAGQVRYTGRDFTMIVVPGRDSVSENGSDPLEYQNTRERELDPWRASSWSGAERTRRVDIGRTATATGSYWWLDSTGRQVFVRNLALVDGGRYHVVQVIGPYADSDKVSEIFDEATKAFRPGR
ncbi:protein kinase [Streptomyces sp. NPDC094049]|uniref:protein kinase n=1 Tax=Streptomyces sp. NPDC094049 TaxID=3154987 RepID=UPI00331BB90A